MVFPVSPPCAILLVVLNARKRSNEALRIESFYFQKIECFCFNHQPLKAQEDIEMALQFYVDPELPEHISTLTLSYTLYDVTESVES